jgi:16S rRNA (guanine527-N7)-methyltransferase
MSIDLRHRLDTGIAALDLTLEEGQRLQLLAYLGLLQKWNRAYNLTAVRDPAEMVTRHLIDSLAVAPHLERRQRETRPLRVVDVGSGAGLPGIPLALVFPQFEFVLLDSNGKKTRFLTQAKAELGLDNVSVIQSRVEEFRPDAPLFDVVIARAFASLGEILARCRHLLVPRGRILAMKGAVTAEELAALPEGTVQHEVVRLMVPGLEGEARHLVCVGICEDENCGKR